jgi:hypothetical protein
MPQRFGAQRQIKEDQGSEARIAEPPASRQIDLLWIEKAKAVWSEATY